MLERYQVNNQWVQKEITAVIEKDATLNREIKQLSNSKCGLWEREYSTVAFPSSLFNSWYYRYSRYYSLCICLDWSYVLI
jgi:hypothetical protein